MCRDSDDGVVLAAVAAAATATVLVTGVQDLLVLKTYQGIPIISPRAFVEFLDRAATSS